MVTNLSSFEGFVLTFELQAWRDASPHNSFILIWVNENDLILWIQDRQWNPRSKRNTSFEDDESVDDSLKNKS